MNAAPQSVESSGFQRLRRFLSGVVMLGVLGMGAELLLIGHTDGLSQLVPVVLLLVAALVLGWSVVRPRSMTVWGVRLAMTAFVTSGLVGVVLHYRGNEAFELEMYPTLSGAGLVYETLTGATPVLAPGSMALLGLVGLAATYRHPAVGRAPWAGPADVPDSADSDDPIESEEDPS
ncbi:MAG: hypothetical protein O3A25_19380 [Acidobacteria bacterium]|nr:hypothetical protein [Acidobacteriota bacterium]